VGQNTPPCHPQRSQALPTNPAAQQPTWVFERQQPYQHQVLLLRLVAIQQLPPLHLAAVLLLLPRRTTAAAATAAAASRRQQQVFVGKRQHAQPAAAAARLERLDLLVRQRHQRAIRRHLLMMTRGAARVCVGDDEVRRVCVCV
jgi:hypothetical protein